MEEVMEDLVLRSSHVFDFHIEELYKLMISPESFKEASPFFQNSNFVKGVDFQEVGSELLLCNPKFGYELKIIVTGVVSEKNYKKLSLTHNYTKPHRIKYFINYHFHLNSIESTTWMFTETKYEKKEEMQMMERLRDNKEKNKFYEIIEQVLIKNKKNLIQTESIVINLNIKKVWDVVTDWRQFIIYAPIVGYKVNYEGNPRSVDTLVHVYFQNQDYEYHLKVTLVEEHEDKKIYCLKFFAGKPKSPKQELRFTFYDIDTNICLLTFEHKFKKCIKYSLITKISEEKVKILKTLKESLEGDI
jgi:hypothetical protein